jgi:hypothetical protein
MLGADRLDLPARTAGDPNRRYLMHEDLAERSRDRVAVEILLA